MSKETQKLFQCTSKASLVMLFVMRGWCQLPLPLWSEHCMCQKEAKNFFLVMWCWKVTMISFWKIFAKFFLSLWNNVQGDIKLAVWFTHGAFDDLCFVVWLKEAFYILKDLWRSFCIPQRFHCLLLLKLARLFLCFIMAHQDCVYENQSLVKTSISHFNISKYAISKVIF